MSVYSALNFSVMSKVKKAWEAVNPDILATYEKLDDLLHPDKNFSKYRSAIDGIDPPCVPYLGVILGDLTGLEEMDTFSDEEKTAINWGKMTKVSRVFRFILRFQRCVYTYAPDVSIQDHIRALSSYYVILDDDLLHKMAKENAARDERNLQYANEIFQLLPKHLGKKNKPGKIEVSGNVEIFHKLSSLSTPFADYHFVEYGGWVCTMKSTKAEYVESVLKEIIILEGLPPHPNIVRYLFHDLENMHLRLFITHYDRNLLGLLQERRSLRSSLKNGGQKGGSPIVGFTDSEMKFILLSLVNALEFLHQYRLVYTDLSPSNIYLRCSGNQILSVVLGDMGNVHIEGTTIKKDDHLFVSSEYAAPEMYGVKKLYGPSLDIWSLGMIVYSLFSLMPPYSEHSNEKIVKLVKSGAKPAPHHLPEDSEYAHLIDLYKQCTKMLPQERPPLSQIRHAVADERSVQDTETEADGQSGGRKKKGEKAETKVSSLFEHFFEELNRLNPMHKPEDISSPKKVPDSRQLTNFMLKEIEKVTLLETKKILPKEGELRVKTNHKCKVMHLTIIF